MSSKSMTDKRWRRIVKNHKEDRGLYRIGTDEWERSLRDKGGLIREMRRLRRQLKKAGIA